MVFSPPDFRRYVGVRGWPGATHKEDPSRSSPLATEVGEPEPIPTPRGRGIVPRRVSRAPEGGGTTQRGDPAPGPMRCGTTASGDERMHQ